MALQVTPEQWQWHFDGSVGQSNQSKANKILAAVGYCFHMRFNCGQSGRCMLFISGLFWSAHEQGHVGKHNRKK
jgi:hypothetical protein